MTHWLTPLLEPKSVAIVGASPREGNVGGTILNIFRDAGYAGPLHAVNPRYEAIGDAVCHPSLDALPETVDLAILAVADGRLEETLAAVITAGCRAAMIFGSAVLAEDGEPPLAQRLSAMAREARLPVCGGNSMGYWHYEAGVRMTAYPFPQRESGHIAFLSQSGSVFAALTNSNPRVTMNLAASVGSEFSVTVADYMDYALERPSTRTIALFLEAVRDPDAFVAALEKADARDVPVVAIKTGRTAAAARMAISHSGALVGDDRVFDAVCRRHGLLRVDTIDALVATTLLMDQPRRPGPGDLASVIESGGERQMIVDLADKIGVSFAAIGEPTKDKLAARLDPGLVAENPCDAYGTGHDYDVVMRDCFIALMADPASAMGVLFLDLREDGGYSERCAQACLDALPTTDKPIALATNYSAVDHRGVALRFTRQGVPVLDGTVPALEAVRHAFAYRDRRARSPETTESTPPVGEAWRERLANGAPLDETESLGLLADYGIAAVPHRIVASRDAAIAAAEALGLPAVVKTAAEGLHHKSDVGGVRLDLATAEAVGDSYDDIAARLGARALVAPHITGGVGMIIGIKTDPQFGPVVLVGAGGIFVELMDDVRAMLAPVGAAEVRATIDALAARPLLDGLRGAPPADIDALVQAIVRLSRLAAELADVIAALDVNPLRVGPDGALALDALVVPKQAS